MKYCIFCERIFDDACFAALKEFIRERGANKIRLFCITPVNYHLAVAEQGFKGDENEFSKILAERYHILEFLFGAKIELHLHLGLRLENIDQPKMHKEAFNWMVNHGFNPRMITYGWYSYNKDSLQCAEDIGMKFFNDRFAYSIHDYQWDSLFSPMMIVTNIRGIIR